jgi:hypothetical protein
MTGRETRIRIGTLSVPGDRFDQALFRRTLTERLAAEKNRDPHTIEALVRDAGRLASKERNSGGGGGR